MNRNEMVLSLKGDTFSDLKEKFDSMLTKTIGNMEMTGTETATVTLKFGITLKKMDVGGPNGIQEITRPSFKYNVGFDVHTKDNTSGSLNGEDELSYKDGKYVMHPIDDGQTTLYDDNNGPIDADYTDITEDDTERQKAISAASEVGPRKLPAASSDAENDEDDYHYEEPEA